MTHPYQPDDRDELIEQLRKQIRIHDKYSDQKEFRQNVLAGLAIFIVVMAIIAGIVYGVIRSDDQSARTAQQCIAAGNIWSHGDCLLTRK